MSASSRTPPSDTRTYSRPMARAIDLATEVLPTPGGPTKSRIGPLAPLSSSLPGRPSPAAAGFGVPAAGDAGATVGPGTAVSEPASPGPVRSPPAPPPSGDAASADGAPPVFARAPALRAA